MTDTQPSSRTRFLAGSLLWGLWLVSASPFFSLFIEFRCRQLGECGAEWWYYARLYSHFFLYPITFGLISTIFLHRPWIQSVHYLFCLPERPRIRTAGVIVFSILLVVGFVSYVEFDSKPSSAAFKNCENPTTFRGSTPAPWSLAPEVMKDEGEGMRVRSLLAERCNRTSALLDDPEKCEFQEKLSVLWKDGDGSLSYTEQFYRAGFMAMTALFALLFATIFIVKTWNSKNKRDLAEERNSENRRMTTLLVLALLFATFWVLMRIAFLEEKLSIYPEDPLLMYNWLILLTFMAVYVHLAISRWPKHRRYEGYLDLIFSIAGFALSVIGLLGGSSGYQEWISDTLVRIFGTGSSPLTYMAVLLFLLVIHFPHILRLLEDDPKSDDPEQRGTL